MACLLLRGMRHTNVGLAGQLSARCLHVSAAAREVWDIGGKTARAHIHATANNTMVTVTAANGDPIAWSSAGKCGFKGAKRGTSYAAEVAGQDIAKLAGDKGVKTVRVLLRGLGQGRNPVMKGMLKGGLRIASITDVTPVPHNGCRPKKQRRL